MVLSAVTCLPAWQSYNQGAGLSARGWWCALPAEVMHVFHIFMIYKHVHRPDPVPNKEDPKDAPVRCGRA